MNKEDYIRLVQEARQGDKGAAEELFESLTVRLRAVVKHRVRWWTAEDREDVIQTALMVFLEKLHEVRDNPCAFVVQILNNQIGNELQKRRLRVNLPLVDDSSDDSALRSPKAQSVDGELKSADDADQSFESRHEISRAIRAIDGLKPFCRALFKGIIEEFTIGEIWDEIRRVEPGLTRSAFDKRVFDCRKRLRFALGNSE